MAADVLLEVNDLETQFKTEEGLIRAVDGISFRLHKGETLGVVGESGCGKSVTSQSIMRMVPKPHGRIVGGQVLYHQTPGEAPIDLTALDAQGERMRAIRGNEIAMIFQEPMTSLNPVYTIGNQIMESILLHQTKSKRDAKARAVEMLIKVGISDPERRIDEYPHEFSGGMRQRAMIAMALACNPNILIADEPTTALDVTIEAQILKLLRSLREEFGMSILFITHDLGVIAGMASRVMVMYTGKIVEIAKTDDLYYNAKHPYTQGLLKSIPKIGERVRLNPIGGSVPNLHTLEKGWCYFAPRCPHAMDICRRQEPKVYEVADQHEVKCWLYAETFREVSA